VENNLNKCENSKVKCLVENNLNKCENSKVCESLKGKLFIK